MDNFAAHNHQVQPCSFQILQNANFASTTRGALPMAAFRWKCLTAIPLVLTGSGTVNVTASAQGGNGGGAGGNAKFSAPVEKMLAPRFVVPLSNERQQFSICFGERYRRSRGC